MVARSLIETSGATPLEAGVVLSMPGRCADLATRIRTNRCDSVLVSGINPQKGFPALTRGSGPTG